MFVGVLGWLDTYLPDWLLSAYALLLLLVAAFDGHVGLRLGLARRAWVSAIGVGGLFGVSLSLYCLWSAVGSPELDSIQGRYFIPLAPVLLLIFCNTTLSNVAGSRMKATFVLPSIVVTWIVVFDRLIERYYLP